MISLIISFILFSYLFYIFKLYQTEKDNTYLMIKRYLRSSAIILTSLFILFNITSKLFAQSDSTSITKNIKVGIITGIVTDLDTKLPLEGVVISLSDLNDAAIKTGAVTDVSGKFSIETPYGTYRMNIDIAGYNGAVNNRIILRKALLNIDTIKLSSGTNVTEEIKVEDEKSNIEFQPGKKVFNVSSSDLYQNGSAVDVLKDVPSVSVDADNNVQLRGSAEVKILIDGRPSGLNSSARGNILEQIPANTIERIEVVTNPDAKYDAEGTSGVINIILKKNDSFGMNGSINLSAGTADKYSSGLNLNAKNKKMNIFGNYNYRFFNSPGISSLDRINLTDNTRLIQNVDLLNRMKNHSFKGGIEFFPDDKNTLAFTLNYTDRNRLRGSTETTIQDQTNGDLLFSSINKVQDDETGKNLDVSLSYAKEFNDPKKQLDLEFSYSRQHEVNTQLSSFYDQINPIANIPKQNDLFDNTDNDAELSLDYQLPLGNKKSGIKLDAGAKSTLRSSNNIYSYQNFDYTTNSFIVNPLSSNSFNYKEFINAAYGIYSGSVKKFTYSLGLRGEQTNATGDLLTTGTQIKQNYFSIFPSLSLSQKLSLGQEVQLTYSRRVRRPDTEDLNPFIERSDPLNLRQGNPDLKPMFIDSYELSLINYIGQTVLTPSVYFRQTHDEITRYRTLLDSNVALTTFANNTSSKTYGAEIIFNSKIFNTVNLNGNINYYRSDVDASNILPGLVNSTYSWAGRLMASTNIADVLSIQFAYNYSGKRATGQGIIDPVQSMDAAIRKDLFNKNASISFRISDILNQQKTVSILTDPSFTETATRRRNTRTAFLTFTYNFGRAEKNKKKDKNKTDDITPPDDSGY